MYASRPTLTAQNRRNHVVLSQVYIPVAAPYRRTAGTAAAKPRLYQPCLRTGAERLGDIPFDKQEKV